MAKYSRITGKVFGASASASGDNPEIGQFGSALAGTYSGTTDVATIQSLSAWSKGFIDAVNPTTQFPTLPEMTGFGKVLSHQICYLLQQGVAEWDSGTTYYTNSWCSYNGSLYISKSDNNTNNTPTNVTYWTKFTGASSRNIGEYVTSSMPLNDSKLHLADGSQLSSTDYPEIFSYAASIYSVRYGWQPLSQISSIAGSSSRAATFGNDIQVVVYSSTYIVYRNYGNQSWVVANVLPYQGNRAWIGVTYDNSYFMAINVNGKIVKSSSNSYSDLGNSWTEVADLTESYDAWRDICYGNNIYIALGRYGYISTSVDGSTWTTPDELLTSGGEWKAVEFDGTNFVALSTTGYISTSVDGSTWTTPTQISNLSTKTWVDFTYNDGKFTALSSDGYLSTSTDGSSWSVPSQEDLPSSSWTAIAPAHVGLYAVSGNYVSEQEEVPTYPFTTEADWQATNTAYGECGKFVYNAGANTLRIPKVNSYFKNTTTLSELGETNPASAPNIKGTFSSVGQQGDGVVPTTTGAFYVAETHRPAGGVLVENSGQRDDILGMSASLYSSFYSDSATTINTQSVSQYVYIVVSQ